MMKDRHVPYGPYEAVIKPVLGWLLALLFVLLFWWLYIIIALLIRSKLGSPVLFTQERPGRINPKTGKEKIFRLYKFRSMADARNSKGELLSDEERLTPFGQKLRRTSLDELPEILFNILIFRNMNWIGPRPLLVKYLDRYSERQHHRHDVKPGLTGLAQVNGRNAITWEEKFEYDLKYVEKVTFLGDVSILLKTVKAVVARDGISSETSVTMEEFK